MIIINLPVIYQLIVAISSALSFISVLISSILVTKEIMAFRTLFTVAYFIRKLQVISLCQSGTENDYYKD